MPLHSEGRDFRLVPIRVHSHSAPVAADQDEVPIHQPPLRRITLHQYGGPKTALMLDLHCQNCGAQVAHDTVTLGEKKTMVVRSQDALVISTSAETAFEHNLVAHAHGFMVRSGATMDALALDLRLVHLETVPLSTMCSCL